MSEIKINVPSMDKIKSFANGKKSYTGVLALTAYYIATYRGWMQPQPVLEYALYGLTGLGVVHKLAKAEKPPPAVTITKP